MSPRSTRRAIIVLVLLQAAVLLVLPLRAGPHIASGTTVRLEATSTRSDLRKPDEPSQELWLDYGVDELDLPNGLGPGDTAFVELLDGSDRGEPARFGEVTSDIEALPDGAVWIKLPVYGTGSGELGAGPIEVWFDEEVDRIDRLRAHLDDEGSVLVTVALDNDGDPEIDDVEAVER